MANFWRNLNLPILALAPMEDVTDSVFRQLLVGHGRPDVMFTEFTNCEGVQSVGQAKVIHRLKFDPIERPLVAQVWGITPEDYYETAKLIQAMGFDGIDINMGCPVKKIIQQGACSALIKNPGLAKDIIQATKQGAPDLPVSVKTRIGFNQIQTEEWCGFLLCECRPDVLIVHGRTVKEESKVPCHWDEIGKVVKMRDEIYATQSQKPLILGNGDVQSRDLALQKVNQYKVDGVMVGRGIFHNPWLFNPDYRDAGQADILRVSTGLPVSPQEKIDLLLEHLDLFENTWAGLKNYNALKKYYKIYIHGFAGATSLRTELMNTTNYQEARQVIQNSYSI
jgi:tRNA-dihydrouridine synthase